MSNFTDRVKRTLNTAREEAKANGNDYIGTEHILLGLMLQTDCVAAEAVKALGIDVDASSEQFKTLLPIIAILFPQM